MSEGELRRYRGERADPQLTRLRQWRARRAESIQAFCEERLDGRRNSDLVFALARVREQLLDEERIPLSGLHDSATKSFRACAPGKDLIDQDFGIVFIEWLEYEVVARVRGRDRQGDCRRDLGERCKLSKIGPVAKPTRYSSMSSNVGSAQWMSSTKATSGAYEPTFRRERERPKRSPRLVSESRQVRGLPRGARRPAAPRLLRRAINSDPCARRCLRSVGRSLQAASK